MQNVRAAKQGLFFTSSWAHSAPMIFKRKPGARTRREVAHPPTETIDRKGAIDYFRDGQVVGWAYDRTSEAPLVRISVDHVVVGVAHCDDQRDDVLEAGHPPSSRGFRFNLPAQYFDGQRHEVEFAFLDGTPLLFSTDQGFKTSLAFTSAFEPNFVGSVDRVEGDIALGWLLTGNRSGARMTGGGMVALYCDGELAGQARADKSRPDVGHKFNADSNCGFTFQIPHRFVAAGVSIEVATFPHRWVLPGSPTRIERLPTQERSRLSLLQKDLDRISIDLWRTQREIARLVTPSVTMLSDFGAWTKSYFAGLHARIPMGAATSGLKVSVLCPVYRPRLKDFAAAVDSVVAQTYQHWELIVVDDASDRTDLTALIDYYAAKDARIKVKRHKKNEGISEATNTAIGAATGDLIAFFDHDDLLVDCALDFMVGAIVETGAVMAYSDEDKIDDRDILSEPNFKPDWNLRLLMAQNYVCHFLVARRDAVLKAGPFASRYNGAQDHDFILRLSDMIPHASIHHVPEILYHWRKTPNSTAETVSNKTYAIDAGVAAVGDYLARNSVAGRVSSRGAMTNYIVTWPRRDDVPVSIIVPFKDNIELTRRCLKQVLEVTDFANFEVVLVNNFSMTKAADDFAIEVSQMANVRMIDVEEPFNYSRLNNLAVAGCTSDLVLFLNNDVFVSDSTWLQQLVGELLWRDDVGAVGCKLVYENGTVQHAGVVLGVGEGEVAEHPFRGLAVHDPGFMGRALCSQYYSAVTAACLLCRRQTFADVGGFDEDDLTVAFNDVDLCLKIGKAGYHVVWRAETVLEHHESASREDDMSPGKLPRFISEHKVMHERWGPTLANDPNYNRNFARSFGVFKAIAIGEV